MIATIVGAFAIIVVFVHLGIKENYETIRRGECVIIQPAVCTRGLISNALGVFSSGPVSYSLWFKGKTSKSGEVCEIVFRVTESQFDKLMY